MADNVKLLLENKLLECELCIKKRKKKYKTFKILYGLLVTLSIVGNSTVNVLSAIRVPPQVVLCISALNTITTGLSVTFNLGDLKTKNSDNIRKLNIIKDKLEYVISCNGNLSKDESDAILYEFRKLWFF